MILTTVSMAMLLALCSLAVDYGHVEMVTTELRRAADASALCGVAYLSYGNSTVIYAVQAAASKNNADGSPVNIASSDVQFINWNTTTGTGTVVANASQANAIKVTARRTKATGNAIYLTLASCLGVTSVDRVASATAYMSVQTTTQTVAGTSNPWLAGEPTGTLASQPDPNYPSADHPYKYDIAGPNGGHASTGEPYCSPVLIPVSVEPNSVVEITSVTGVGVKNDPIESAYATANGMQGGSESIYDDAASDGVAEHGIADATMPLNALNGVFLDNNLPDNDGTPPTPLDFSTSAEQNYSTISPQLRQPFYIGTGTNTSGQQQEIVVPSGATRFYIGTMDGWEWSNNLGDYVVTLTETKIALVQ